MRVMALLVDPTDPTPRKPHVSEVQAAARTLGLELHVLNASTESDFNEVFPKVEPVGGWWPVIGGGPFFVSHSEQLAALTARHAVPVISSIAISLLQEA